jgi:hypothetical protein
MINDLLMNKQNTQHPVRKTSFYYGYIIVIASFVILMLAVGTFFSAGLFFKPMLNEFAWTRAVTSGPMALTGPVTGVASLILGSLTDRLGPRAES